jgi:Mg2+-importing ATPase
MSIGLVKCSWNPAARDRGFRARPRLYWPLLAATLLGYLLLTQAVKSWLLRRKWI